MARFSLVIHALRELGPRPLGLYALYQMGLRLGYFRYKTQSADRRTQISLGGPSITLQSLLDLPRPEDIKTVIGRENLSLLMAEADEILRGEIRMFGGAPMSLVIDFPESLDHWTAYATGKTILADPTAKGNGGGRRSISSAVDIKYIWEPARFGWAFTLAKAYYLVRNERYPEIFWQLFEKFQKMNPANMGPNWISAQEVALRIMAFVFAGQVFSDSPYSTNLRKKALTQAIAAHAARILPTLVYSRSQNNNHLLSEAAGLITASLALPDHPEAKRWAKLGWKWFNRGLETQIDKDGAYIQNSSNYQRLMLQLALWISSLQRKNRIENRQSNDMEDQKISDLSARNLKRATQWLDQLTDSESGRAPNLGPNDGSYIFPLTILPYDDYRPVVQAASWDFLGKSTFIRGPWDEMALWFNISEPRVNVPSFEQQTGPSVTLKNSVNGSWAYLRTARFSDRPGHADQLHVDLWWRGLNIARDAGTYRYNADSPWDNTLTHTAVHNTVMVDGQEQMTRAGRFLYVNRAQGEILACQQPDEAVVEQKCARHDGYKRFGICHDRRVTAFNDGRWEVEDYIHPVHKAARGVAHEVRVHWLLPNWEHRLSSSEGELLIRSPYGWIKLRIRRQDATPLSSFGLQASLIRVGEFIHGTGRISPTWGWYSPTYGVKIPALSFAVTITGALPLKLVSEWRFPGE